MPLLAQFSQPQGVAVDANGNMYVADRANNRIRKITAVPGPTITSFSPAIASPGTTVIIRGSFFTNAVAVSFGSSPASSFTIINDSTIHSVVGNGQTGYLSVTLANGGISGLSGFTYCTPVSDAKIAANATSIIPGITIAFTATAKGSSLSYQWKKNNNNVGTDRSIYSDNGLHTGDSVWCVIKAACNVKTTEATNKIYPYVSAGRISTIAGNGTFGYSGDGGPALLAQINWTGGIAVDTVGNVYIADRRNDRVRKVGLNGIITTIAGNGTPGFSGDGAAAVLAQLNSPYNVTVDNSGNIYYI